jgi:cytochrome c biogenesis protein CcdA
VFAIIGFIGMKYGAIIASKLQNFGSGVQRSAQSSIGADNPIGALIMGLTLGLVWVPCAGPALSFVFALLRERPGIESIILLTAYGAGTAMPLLLIGYGGQYAVHSVRFLSKFSGKVKQISGVLLIVAALGLQFNVFRNLETWLVQNTSLGTVGTTIEVA